MKRLILLTVIVLQYLTIVSQTTVNCLIKTSLGNIQIELYPEKAAITVENFLKYVDSGFYTESNFYRVCTEENEADREIEHLNGRLQRLQDQFELYKSMNGDD